MSKEHLGYIIQFAGAVALAVAVFYAGNLIKALVVGGAAALVVGRYVRTKL